MAQYRFAAPLSQFALETMKQLVAEADGVPLDLVRVKRDPHPAAADVVFATTDEIDHWPDFDIDQ